MTKTTMPTTVQEAAKKALEFQREASAAYRAGDFSEAIESLKLSLEQGDLAASLNKDDPRISSSRIATRGMLGSAYQRRGAPGDLSLAEEVLTGALDIITSELARGSLDPYQRISFVRDRDVISGQLRDLKTTSLRDGR